MGFGILKIDLRALEGALQLPEGYHIRAVLQDAFSTKLSLFIEGAAIPEVDEGMEYPELMAIVHVWYPDNAFTSEYKKYDVRLEVVEKGASGIGG